MNNILIIHSGLQGITNACLEVARCLEQKNWTVYTATMKDQRKTIESNAFSYIELQKIQINYHKDVGLSNFIKQAVISKNKFYESIYNNLQFDKFEKILKSYNINALLIDMELHEYIMYSSKLKIPFILVNQWFSIWESPRNLPLQSCVSPSSALENKLVWKLSTLQCFLKTAGHHIKTLGANRRNFIKYLANRVQFDMSTLQSYRFPLPFSYNGIQTISLTHPQLEFSENTTETLSYAYPMVFEKRIELETDQFTKDFTAIIKEKENNKLTLIVATYTTMKGANQKGLPSVLNALAELNQSISIVSIGSHYSNKLRKEYLDKGVYIYSSIPQLKVLKHADLSINHGGIHTINECIHYEVPMVILSGAKHDQNGCAIRVSEFGCGLTFCNKNYSKQDILTKVNQVLIDPSFKSKITELNKSLRNAKEKEVLEKLIQKLFSLRE